MNIRDAIERVINKYDAELCWGDRGNNMVWVDTMMDDIAKEVEAELAKQHEGTEG